MSDQTRAGESRRAEARLQPRRFGRDAALKRRTTSVAYYLILCQDLGYGQSELLMSTLEETSKLLNAYARAIPASGS
jgi:hypothetical protein